MVSDMKLEVIMDHNIHREISRTLPGNGHLNILPQVPIIHKEMDSLKKTVQTVKRMLEKARIDAKDPYISLLEYRNTPTESTLQHSY